MTRFESKLIGAGLARSLTHLAALAAILIATPAQSALTAYQAPTSL